MDPVPAQSYERTISLGGDAAHLATLTFEAQALDVASGEYRPYKSGQARVGGERWSIEDLWLRQGHNRLVLTAKDPSGNPHSRTLQIECLAPQGARSVALGESGQIYVNDTLFVTFAADVPSMQREAVVQACGGQIVGALEDSDTLEVRVQPTDWAGLNEHMQALSREAGVACVRLDPFAPDACA